MLAFGKFPHIKGGRDITFTIFVKNDVTSLGLSYLITTSKAIILSSPPRQALRDLKARMAGIIIESIRHASNKNPARGDIDFKSDFHWLGGYQNNLEYT
jgi:hypothetical protein